MHLCQSFQIELSLGDVLQNIETTPASGTQLSQTWDISDCSILANCIHVNSTISMQYQNHLAQGLEMPVSFSSVVGTRHVVTNQSFTLSLARSLTHLKALFFVLVSTAATEKEVKDFRINVAGETISTAQDAFQWQVVVGSRRYPDYPVQGGAESYYRLQQAVHVANNMEDISLTPAVYTSSAAIFGIDFEKSGDQGTAFSGINTQGQTLSLVVSNAWPSDDNNPRHVFCYRIYDSILNIRGPGGVDIIE